MNVKKLFGRNLRRLRNETDLSQEAFSEKVGLQPQTISNFEIGRHFISAESLELLCQYLKVTPLEFFLSFKQDIQPTDKEKIDVINSILSNMDSEKLEQIYKMILALR